MLKKYGVTSYTKTNECKQKITQSCLDKYGVKTALQLDSCKAATTDRIYQQSYDKMLNCEYDVPLFTLAEYKQRVNDAQQLKFKCLKCGNIFEVSHHDGAHFHCPECYPRNMNFEEKELATFMNQLCKDLVCNTRSVISPLELDMYSPSKKIAVEFDGLYWHSLDNKNSNYHLNKTILCEQQNIQLVHVLENEWLCKQEIVKSRLKNLFGMYDKTIFARKCIVKEIDSTTSRQFQEKNHIQGAVNSKVNLGLYFNDEFVSLMTFGKCRFNKKYEWEMLRFCSKLGYHVVGAAGKLLKHFEMMYNPKSLVSYADRRWSQGKLYKALGFKLDHASPPNYWYWKDLTLESRLKYQKHKLRSLLLKYDDNLTEVQNMENNGYRRIFDCGNLVFKKEYSIL